MKADISQLQGELRLLDSTTCADSTAGQRHLVQKGQTAIAAAQAKLRDVRFGDSRIVGSGGIAVTGGNAPETAKAAAALEKVEDDSVNGFVKSIRPKP